ncbi:MULTISPECIES: dihydrodipicolinate synthase family protein [Halomonadaceae]|uniref:Dihydrodipicolinate synthase family protein n=1 Tax=Modicisalibacter zincidurans TaxID=1178777 RepID=A0ABP9R3L2_9GAMM|nr:MULTISPECIES: dihydrodipicolinate synthase family protein [Halomonas]MCD6007293.1 dihydrodipicolinate synthase family protein [Halomonas sp. IOP_31]
MNFDGIWTPVVTPFAADNTVSLDTLGKVIDTLIDRGVHGLIIGGM